MGIKTSFIDKVINARQRQAQLYANQALSQMDDKTLTSLGYSPTEVRSRPRRAMPLF
jgi:hypothetical protein